MENSNLYKITEVEPSDLPETLSRGFYFETTSHSFSGHHGVPKKSERVKAVLENNGHYTVHYFLKGSEQLPIEGGCRGAFLDKRDLEKEVKSSLKMGTRPSEITGVKTQQDREECFVLFVKE